MAGIRLPRRGIVLPKPSTSFFHVHAHSAFSWNDALPQVKEMVDVAVRHGQPALALTDHGNMGGAVQLYQECAKAGIKPFPGVEAYLVKDREDKKAKRYHLGLLALTTPGYEALVRLSSKSHTRDSFHHKPLIDLSDLAEWKERGWTKGLALTTGCYFGLVVQTIVTEGPVAAKHVVHRLASLVDHTFIELQNHKIDHGDGWDDSRVAAVLFEIAQELGLPIVLAQDAHYCEPSDKPVHETLKRVVAFGPDPDDAVFPGDGFHLSDAAWVQAHHEPRHWIEAEQGYRTLLEAHDLHIPELDSYSYNIPKTVSSPDEVLTKICTERLLEQGLTQAYADRLGDELAVVLDTGMAGYLLLVREVTDWCQANGVLTQARGSASGSLICWLLGITQCDPIKYKLRFERFISRDRTKPPDIDLDVEDTRREDLIAWLRGRFTVCQIGTYGTYGIDEKEGSEREGRGSLIVAYKKIAKAQGVDTSEITTIQDIPEEWREPLLTLSAKKVKKNAGTHAAGLIVTSARDDLDRLVPTMGIPTASGFNTVSQYAMNDVEALGLVKLDVLGLRTLSLLRRVTELLQRDPREGLDFIPLDDTRTFTGIRNGATGGVFQLEGGTAQRGCREVKVRSLKDIIVIQALYRPAVMKTGGKDAYIARRNGVEKVPDYHPILMKTIKETYGIPVFQEQVISILRDLGMQPDELTDFLKAIKGSQKADIIKAQATMAAAKDQVRVMCDAVQMSTEDFVYIWQAIEGFAEYGFNRAHATAYGITAYRCAYLKINHPLEFATALLETSEGTPKEDMYVSEVRKMGIRILRPHVNISGASYSIDHERNAVRRGLVSIKGIGPVTAAEVALHAPYENIDDLIKRVDGRKCNGGKSWEKHRTLNGNLETLREAGALAELIPD